jgi:transcriptional repressor NrdR
MVCPFCLHKDTSVYNSRQTTRLNNVWRRRKCESCKKAFTTIESVDPGSVIQVAGKRTLKPYVHANLTLSILRVFDHIESPEESATYIAQTVLQKLYKLARKNNRIVSKEDIATTVLETLKPYNTAAYIKYLSYHAPNLDAKALKKQL